MRLGSLAVTPPLAVGTSPVVWQPASAKVAPTAHHPHNRSNDDHHRAKRQTISLQIIMMQAFGNLLRQAG
jgi:hypothetical protein